MHMLLACSLSALSLTPVQRNKIHTGNDAGAASFLRPSTSCQRHRQHHAALVSPPVVAQVDRDQLRQLKEIRWNAAGEFVVASPHRMQHHVAAADRDAAGEAVVLLVLLE